MQPSAITGAPGDPSLVTLPDRVNYTVGQYGAYASPWSTFVDKSLRQDIDYADAIVVNPQTFADASAITWHWPNHQSTTSGVWGYMSVWFGNYDGGEPAVRVPPRQVKNIARLDQAFSLSVESSGYFNVLNEFYLTSQAGQPASKLIEIGYFLHPSASAMASSSAGLSLGSFVDAISGQTWTVSRQDTFCMLLPAGGTDVLSGSIDVESALAFLMTRGVITGHEWFNGIALGVEPVSGSGALKVDHWKVTYQ